eukprot:403373973
MTFNSNQQSNPQKELMLKKLLESQESYIQELELKNREFKDQINAITSKDSQASSQYSKNQDVGLQLGIDLQYLEQPEVSSTDKLQYLQDKLQQISPILFQSLTQLKIQFSLEQQLLKESFKYKETLSKQGNQMIKRDRQEMQEEFEVVESQFRQQVKALEQEIRILKDMQYQTDRSDKSKEYENRQRVMEELDQLVMSHKRREEDMKKEISILKLKLDKAFNGLEDQIAQNETQKARYERLMLEKDSAHQLQSTQLQKLLKDTIKELQKSQQQQNQKQVSQTQSQTFANKSIFQNDSLTKENLENLMQQPQGNKENQKNAKNNSNSSQQKLMNDADNYLQNLEQQAFVQGDSMQTIFDSNKYLKLQLDNQQAEVQHWRDCVSNMAEKFSDQQQIYDENLKIANLEKKNLQQEIKAVVKAAGEREQLMERELQQIRDSNKSLMGFGEMREKILQEELNAIKSEIKNIQKSYAEKELQHIKEREMFQKELEEYQILVDQIHLQIESQRVSGNSGKPNEIQLMQNLVLNLQKQLSDANDLLAKNGLSNSKSVKDLFMTKLDNHMQDQKQRFLDQIQNVLAILNTQREHFDFIVHEKDQSESISLHKFTKAVEGLQTLIGEIETQGKGSYQPAQKPGLQQKQSNQNSQRVGQMQNKTSQQQNDYYQAECESMWDHIQVLETEKKAQLQTIESLTGYINNLLQQQNDQQVKYAESFDMHQKAIQTLQHLISNQFVEFENLRLTELKAFQESYNQQQLIMSRESSQKSFGVKGVQSVNQSIISNAGQNQNWFRERQLLFEEISLLRSQIEIFTKNYNQIMNIRQSEYHLLQQERRDIKLVSDQLKETFLKVQSADNTLQNFTQQKQDFLLLNESEAIQDLQLQNNFLQEKLSELARLHQDELIQMTLNFETKIMELKEKEAAKDFIINKQKKELDLVQSEYSIYVTRNDQNIHNMKKEVDRLRKFLNDRQQDIQSERQKVGSQIKKMKDAIKEKDVEFSQIKNDKYTRYLKLLNNTSGISQQNGSQSVLIQNKMPTLPTLQQQNSQLINNQDNSSSQLGLGLGMFYNNQSTLNNQSKQTKSQLFGNHSNL